jgi:hypothetical protein
MSMSEKNCGLCQHYKTNPQNVKQGLCHRYPPVAFFLGMMKEGPAFQMHTPVVNIGDFCGEFSARISALK